MADTPIPVAHAAEATHAAGGLPQFDAQWWPGQIVWALVIFLVLYVVLSKMLLPRVADTLADRERRILDDVEQARKLRNEAEELAAAAEAGMNAARERAQHTAAEAKAKAAAEAHARQEEDEARLSKRISEAEARIRQATREAMAHLDDIATDTAATIVAKLSGRMASAEELSSTKPS